MLKLARRESTILQVARCIVIHTYDLTRGNDTVVEILLTASIHGDYKLHVALDIERKGAGIQGVYVHPRLPSSSCSTSRGNVTPCDVVDDDFGRLSQELDFGIGELPQLWQRRSASLLRHLELLRACVF